MDEDSREGSRGDAELIAAVRGGDQAAMDELYRRHQAAAHGFAASLAGAVLGPDLVAEAITRMLGALQSGKGPDVAFRPYLLTSIRNAYVDHVRRDSRLLSVAEFEAIEDDLAYGDGADDRFASSVVRRAFRSLPERWQVVLWHTAVEDQPLRNVAEHLGMTPNAVSGLSFRAREGLREAYLAEHLNDVADPTCRQVLLALPKLARGSLRGKSNDVVDTHLRACESCRLAAAELSSLSSNLGALLVPVVLGAIPARAVKHLTGKHAATGLSRAAAIRSVGAVVGAAAVVAAVLAWPHDAGTMRGTVAPQLPSRTASPLATATPTSGETSRPPPRQTPTTRAEPQQAPSVAPSATPVTPSPSAVQTPTAAPSPGPTRTVTAAPAPARAQASLGTPTWEPLTDTNPRWYHVHLPVRASTGRLQLVVRTSETIDLHVHQEADYGAWRCKPSVAAPQTLTCLLSAGRSASRDFALDLQAPGSVSIAAVISVTEGREANTSDNTAHLLIPG